MFDAFYRKFIYLPKHEKLARKHFAVIADKDGHLPLVTDLEKSISVVLANTHESITRPRPKMPGQINIAGAHIQQPKPLPAEIEAFINDAEHGVIYFSLGAFMKSSEMPKETLAIILNVFSKLRQRILWKFEDETLSNVPENVMIKKWMPQNDILANDKVILFISHGGMFGTFEGLYWGRPSLFMPFYGDQHRNSLKAEQQGYALRMSFTAITEESFGAKINELIENKKYSKRVQELSVLLRDNPIQPMNEAMYWIEYVIKHKGAKHLKSRAVNMNFFEYTMLDVFAFFGTILLSTLVAVISAVKLLCCRRKIAEKPKTQ
jgi:glucuronosyltransferase